MNKHTPGPWMVLPATGRHQFVVLTENGPRLDIAETYGWPDTPREANAKLIAAAPDLLEALILLEKEMVESGNAGSTDYGWKPAIEKTRAAIAKATA